jgi:hypothetical protein
MEFRPWFPDPVLAEDPAKRSQMGKLRIMGGLGKRPDFQTS